MVRITEAVTTAAQHNMATISTMYQGSTTTTSLEVTALTSKLAIRTLVMVKAETIPMNP